ncbi:MAG: hypothetical protein EA355_11575 [Rhodobacteraceae bacterium]|nr:MAG: hypothetical protein EA355_11575 [Paracoccaceae bacterium]
MDEEKAKGPGAKVLHYWRSIADGGVAALLIGLTVFGVIAADMGSGFAMTYWVFMPVAFGVGSLVLMTVHGAGGASAPEALIRLALHWLGAFAAVRIVFYFVETDRYTLGNAGMACGAIIALAAFLDGVHMQWRMAPIGLALLAAAGVIAFFGENMFVIASVLLLGLVGTVMVSRMQGGSRGAETPAE